MTTSRRIDHRPAEPAHKAPVAVRPVSSAMATGRSAFELAGPDRFRRTLGALRRGALPGEAETPSFSDARRSSFAEAARAAAGEGPLVLLGGIEESPSDPAPDSRDGAPSNDADDSRGDSSSESSAHEAPPMGAEPAPAPGLAAPRGPEGLHGDERQQPTMAASGAAAVGAADGLPAWLVETAQQIEWLCARADPAFQTWAVTVPMDPVTLPDAELALSLSHFSITLRFRTRSEHSALLVSRHRGHLQALLEKLPSLPQSIDIDLE